MEPLIEGMPDQIASSEDNFGPYPLSSYGIAVTDSPDGVLEWSKRQTALQPRQLAADRRDDARPGLMGVDQQYCSHEFRTCGW